MEDILVYRPHAAMDARTRVARNVRKYRVNAGLTQEELAGRAKLHPTYVSRIETAYNNVTVDVLDKIALALRLDVSELLKKG